MNVDSAGQARRQSWALEGVNELESSVNSPLLASPQGGVAERSKNIAKHPLIAKPGWFSDRNKRKTTPAASVLVASQNFLDDAATPPCGDARRGLLRSSNLFTPSLARVCLYPALTSFPARVE